MVSVYQMTSEGNRLIKNVPNKKNRITLAIRKEMPYLLIPKNYRHKTITNYIIVIDIIFL